MQSVARDTKQVHQKCNTTTNHFICTAGVANGGRNIWQFPMEFHSNHNNNHRIVMNLFKEV